jgi:hypothetical protein
MLLIATILVSSAAPATAQVQPRQYGPDPLLNRPAVSPYMNLMRSDSGRNVNYDTLVRPQMESMQRSVFQQRQIQQLQRQVSQGAQQGGDAAGLTGHRTFFGNYSHYYPSLGAGGSSAAGRAARAPVRR